MNCTHCEAPTADGIYLCDTAEGDLFALLGTPPAPELLMDDGLHFTLAGQERLAREVLRTWSALT